MAIAFDASSKGISLTDVTSLTLAHTCTGANLTLCVVVGIGGNANTCTGVTYNGVAMTLGKSINASNLQCYIYYLANPATGANNIVASFSDLTSPVVVSGISLTGTNVTSPLGASTSASGTNTLSDFTKVIATSYASSIIVTGFMTAGSAGGDAVTAIGTNQTLRQNYTTTNPNFGDSTQTTTTAGNYTNGYSYPTPGAYAYSLIEIRQTSLGPANLKTINGLAEASIKTVNGLASASVKTFNGLT